MSKCLNPTSAWICGTCLTKDGVVSPRLVFSPTEAMRYFQQRYPNWIEAYEHNCTSVPCGKCAACLIQKRKDMSTRLALETQVHDDACFITLTYDDDHLPVTDWLDWSSSDKMLDRGLGELPEPTLLPRDVQLFIKRLRRHLEYQPVHNKSIRDHVDHPIRYFCVGEYGSRTHRPHYHLIIFGWKPSDVETFHVKDGIVRNTSAQLSKLWPYGFHVVENVDSRVAKYCARYVTKKLTKAPDSHSICPEFILQSVKDGGIGSPWLSRYADYLRNGFVNVRYGNLISKTSIPRYFYRRLRKINPVLWLELRDARIDFIASHPDMFEHLTYEALLRYVRSYQLQDKHLSQFETF